MFQTRLSGLAMISIENDRAKKHLLKTVAEKNILINIYLFLLYAKNSPMLKKLDYRYNKASKKIVSTGLNDRSSATGGNIGLWNQLGITYENPTFLIPNGRRITYVPDAPHLLKLDNTDINIWLKFQIIKLVKT
ncbi:Uncharacterized protein FWK35_00023315, partial [Aphis craccivora]